MNLILSGTLPISLRYQLLSLTKATKGVFLRSTIFCLIDVSSEAVIRPAVETICASAQIDHAFVEPTISLAQFRLLVLDMDSTLIAIECIDELADYVGKKKEVAEITAAAMRGEIADFSESLRRRLSYLAGVDESVLRKVYDERIKLTSGAKELIEAAHQNGMKTILVSGGFTYFAERLANELGLTAAYANELEVIDGRLTGNVIGKIIGPQEKALIVGQALEQHQIRRDQAIVIGDGSNDIAMMNLVDASFAFHAKPIVNHSARYSIRYGSLTTVLDFLRPCE